MFPLSHHVNREAFSLSRRLLHPSAAMQNRLHWLRVAAELHPFRCAVQHLLPRNDQARCNIPPFAAHTDLSTQKRLKSTHRRHAIAYSAQKQHEKVTQFPPIILVHYSFVKPAAQLSNRGFLTTLRRALTVHNSCHSSIARQRD